MTVLCRQTLNPQGSGNSRHNNPIQVFFFFFNCSCLCSQQQFFTLRHGYVALHTPNSLNVAQSVRVDKLVQSRWTLVRNKRSTFTDLWNMLRMWHLIFSSKHYTVRCFITGEASPPLSGYLPVALPKPRHVARWPNDGIPTPEARLCALCNKHPT